MIVISCPTNHPSNSKTSNDKHQDGGICCQELKRLEALVHHYMEPGVTPPSAKILPSLKVHAPPAWNPWHSWKYAWFVASKATQMTGDALAHTLWGPRKKSWGIQMTLMSSLMRGSGQHTDLMDVPSIRLFMSMGGFGPPPADALVTPVTFQVKRRRLRGILESLDAKETGHRELSGEWIVGKRTWQRLQTEWKAAQVGQRSHKHKNAEHVILYIHGGAYYVGSAEEKRIISVPLAQYTDARVFSLNYRLAPECTFPGPLYDVVSAYFRLTEDLHIPVENIIVSGDSAGGGLSLALLMYLRDNHYPMPAGGILMSPWVDMTMSCKSWDSNAAYDVIPQFDTESHINPIANYLGNDLEKYLMHPYASPIFGDFHNLPPLLIQSGDSEVLQDEITLLANKAELAGVKVRHEEYEDGVHVFQTFPFLKIWTIAFMSMGNFVQSTLPHLQSRTPKVMTQKAEKFMETEMDTHHAMAVSSDGRVAGAAGKIMEGTSVHDSDDETVYYSDSDDDHCATCGHGKTWSLEEHHHEEPHVKVSVVPPTVEPTTPSASTDPSLATGWKRMSGSYFPSQPLEEITSATGRKRMSGSGFLAEPPVEDATPKSRKRVSSDYLSPPVTPGGTRRSFNPAAKAALAAPEVTIPLDAWHFWST